MDLKAQARELVTNLGGHMNASPYDIAWLARLPADDGYGGRWPGLINWLLEHQRQDGSWGGGIPYYHDRILCTLMAIIALKERGRESAVDRAIQKGENYVWRNLHFLHHDPIELVGFELIFPTLLAQARTLELDVPAHSCGYGSVRAAKLRLLPEDSMYIPGTSVAFSLEFLGAKGEPDRLGQMLGANGSIANSPATTAYLLFQGGRDQAAQSYLEELVAQPRGIPHFFPLRTFEIAWVLEHLTFGGFSLQEDDLVAPFLWEELQSALGEEGVSMDPAFGIKDGDTTAVSARVLSLSGRPVDPEILHRFEDPETRIFRTFEFERNASVSTNAHALEALALMPSYPDRQEVWDRVVTMLLAARKYQSYWIDKWHASPYYATSHVLISLLHSNEPLVSECLGSLDWLIHMQRDDGSWGYFDRGTAEETAYALLALLHYHRRFNMEDADVLRRGADYLQRAFESELPYPDLWIAKSLFAPEGVVRSAILAALFLFQETFGHAPG
jgi:halimadienyl-diphosphate synthase